MENMDKGLTVPKSWVLINRPKIPQMPQDWDFDEKKASLSVLSPCAVLSKACAFQQKIVFAFNTIISRHRKINVIKCKWKTNYVFN